MFFLPINRDRPPEHTPYVTWSLIVANSAIWIVLTFSGLNNQVIQEYGLRPAHWTVATLLAHMFLHVGLLHVAGNMWFLWMFAPKLEERLGEVKFTLAYLVSGVGAAGLHSLIGHGSTVPLVGASGAISGVAGMYFLLFPRSPFDLIFYLGWLRLKTFNCLTRVAVGVWIGEQLAWGLITSSRAGSGVAFWAHVGGFVTGLAIGGAVTTQANEEERRAILRPPPLTAEERD